MSSNDDPAAVIALGALVMTVGVSGYLGKGRPISRLPGLTDKQNSLVLAAAGLLLIIGELVSLL